MPGYGFGRGFGVATRRRGVSYSAEAKALFERFTTPPTAQRKTLINDLIVSLKDAGVWSKLDALYVMAAADAQAARQNWIADQYNLTAVAAPTFTTDRGYLGDGVSSYLSTGFNPTSASTPNYSLNDSHTSVWSRTNSQNSAAVSIGARTTSTTAQSLMIVRTAGDGFIARINQDASTGSSVPNTGSTGHLYSQRTGATAKETFRNGSSLGAATEASAAVPDASIFVMALNTGGSAGNYDARQMASASIGASLSSQQVSDFHTALSTYLTAVGAA